MNEEVLAWLKSLTDLDKIAAVGRLVWTTTGIRRKMCGKIRKGGLSVSFRWPGVWPSGEHPFQRRGQRYAGIL